MKKKSPKKKIQKEHRDISKNINHSLDSESAKQIPIVGVGASAGGLSAFKDLFEAMPSDTGMAFVLIQHLDPTHESLMVDLLSRHTKMPVVQVEDRMPVKPNHVYMIPPSWNLAIQNGKFKLTKPLQRRGMRMAIDFFFNSLAEDQRERAICIILSGTGSDGTMGLKAVKSYGGMVMVQAAKEAQYDGMPSSAIATGVVDYVLPVKKMPTVLINYIQHSYIRGHFGTEPIEIDEPDHFNSILAIMHAQIGHNFHYYKKNTVIRRIKRRMGLKQLEQMHDYVNYLRNNPEETKELFKDLLIGVTGFFREKESWEVLVEIVLTPLVASKQVERPLRVWIPGCSSGEEAYTTAILLQEKFTKLKMRPDFNIFATDIDLNALEFARLGRYPESIASAIPETLLEKYFKKVDGFFRVSDRLRENIVFSAQNLISDPPFSKIDLITCRNLLIYLESQIQQRVIELFHFALNKRGYLSLGNSETIGQSEDLFKVLSKKWRIYQKRETGMRTRVSFPISFDKKPWERMVPVGAKEKKPIIKPAEIMREALLKQFAPISILITRSHEILYHFGDTGKYLRFPAGEPTNDLFSLTREGLTTRMRGAVHKAIRSENPVVISNARVKRDGQYYDVSFTVTSLNELNDSEGLFLVSFREETRAEIQQTEPHLSPEEETVVKQLEHELSSTKEELQNTIEELETSNEELKASNEEVMSMNEELQSSNEELETSKEELQSLNEELNTVNNELQEKVRSLEERNNDITNLVNSTNIAAIFLDTQYRIKFYTPASKELFNIIATDIDRPLEHITPRIDDSELLTDARDVLDTLKIASAEVQNDQGQWYHRRIFPYRTQDGRIEGIVLTFENITTLKEHKDELVRQNIRYADAQRIARLGYWELDLKQDHLYWSDETYRIFEIEKNEFGANYDAFLAAVHPDDREYVDREWKAGFDKKTYDIEHRLLMSDGSIKWVREKAQLEFDEQGNCLRGTGFTQDITERKQADEEMRLLARYPTENPNPILRIRKDGIIQFANAASRPILAILESSKDGSLAKEWKERIEDIYNSQKTKEIELKDNKRFFSLIVTPFTDTDYLYCYGIDITKRKQAEEKLNQYRQHLENLIEREARYNMFFDNIYSGIIVCETIDGVNDFKLVDINKVGLKIDGVKKKDVIGRKISQALPGFVAFGILEMMGQVSITGKPVKRLLSVCEKDGMVCWRDINVFKLPTGEIVVLYNDLTQQKKTESSLRVAEHEKALILDTISEVITHIGTNRKIRWVSNAAAKALGEKPKNLIGKSCHEVWCLNEDSCEKCPSLKAIQSKKKVQGSLGDVRGVTWDVIANPITDDSGQVIGVVEIRRPEK